MYSDHGQPIFRRIGLRPVLVEWRLTCFVDVGAKDRLRWARNLLSWLSGATRCRASGRIRSRWQYTGIEIWRTFGNLMRSFRPSCFHVDLEPFLPPWGLSMVGRHSADGSIFDSRISSRIECWSIENLFKVVSFFFNTGRSFGPDSIGWGTLTGVYASGASDFF